MKQLILGGSRSGKSRLAENYAKELPMKRVYVATAQALDAEMQARISLHQAQRDDLWDLVEAPIQLAAAIEKYCAEDTCVLVDCLTLWLSNCLLSQDKTLWAREREALMQVLNKVTGSLILVGNEVGSGIVPMGELSRLFVDENGRLHQDLAALCDKVVYVVAGLPHVLKPNGQQ